MELKQSSNFRNISALIILSYVFFFLGNGLFSLTVPDEVFYVQTAKEMIQHNNWMTPYLFGQPQFEKPVFLYWILRIGFMLFGENSFAARLGPALFAAIGVLAVYALAVLGFNNRKKAFISSVILMSSGFYIGLARTVFTDMIFSVLILLALLSFYWGYLRNRYKALSFVLFFVLAGAAVLTKGPLGVIIPCFIVIVFLALRKDLKYLFSKYLIWGIAVFLLISLPWYALMFKKYGQGFTREFFYNDHLRRFLEAEHYENDTWYFYPLSMVLCMFPWTVYVVIGLFSLVKKIAVNNKNAIYDLLFSWISVVFLVFQPAHSKLASYIFPCFPPLAIMAGSFIYDAQASPGRQKNSVLAGAIITSAVLMVMFSVLIILLFNPPGFIVEYIPYKPLSVLILLLLAILISFIILTLRDKFIKSLYVLMLVIPVTFVIIPFVYNNLEPYISTREICKYLLDNYNVNNTILCSKPFVRGVKYYTNKEVAVIDIPGKQFFSSHPIPFLNSGEKVMELFRNQKITYCILKKSSLVDVECFPVDFALLGDEFDYKILKKIGNKYALKVTLKKSLIN